MLDGAGGVNGWGRRREEGGRRKEEGVGAMRVIP